MHLVKVDLGETDNNVRAKG